jgi:thiamine-phosphate pyrophosphorylase
MDPAREETIARVTRAWGEGSIDYETLDPRIVIDWSESIGPLRGVYEGVEGARKLLETFREAFAEVRWQALEQRRFGPERVVLTTQVDVRGLDSGVETAARGAQVWTFAGEKISHIKMFQNVDDAYLAVRQDRLDDARLYFVCDALEGVRSLLEAALEGGADVVQLRDPGLTDDEVVEAAASFRAAADEHGALFILNDRPDLVTACAADGVHVGQDDAPVDAARSAAGPGAIVGLSTHSPQQLDAASAAAGDARPDYVSVGPVWETPTKPGRPATGLGYVRQAAAGATFPWFAIGGIDTSNAGEVVDAGAERIVVVRAIRDAADPEAAARGLRRSLPDAPSVEFSTPGVGNPYLEGRG